MITFYYTIYFWQLLPFWNLLFIFTGSFVTVQR